MEEFHNVIKKMIYIWAWIFLGAVFSGALYAAQLVGFDLFVDTLLNPLNTRSLHITLMLYGPVMLALSLLPFALFDKDGLNLQGAIAPLKNYFFLWHLFLFMATISILLGVHRGLPFYDFAYELNFLLAASGVFYIIAIFKSIKHYDLVPLWVKVSKFILFTAPIALLVLMNPQIGQVEKTLVGPHGDNTLGMSFTIIPIFYLLIKLHTKKENFAPRWHIFWIVPLALYIFSVGVRIFRGDLSYNEEWFAQWLTFAYAPLLYRWCKDAGLTLKNSPYLVISIWAFLFVMIQGNILFIPEIRAAIHKNNLVIAHAHVAMALGIFYMALAVLEHFYKIPKQFSNLWLIVVALIFFPLTYAGFVEADIVSGDVLSMWWIRFAGGFLAVGILLYYIFRASSIKINSTLALYNLVGFASDGLGAVFLFLFAPVLFHFLGFAFHPLYYVVFGFMGFVGFVHLLGVFHNKQLFAYLTAIARLITATIFFSLFYIKHIDLLGLLVGLYDFSYALAFFLLREKF